MLTEEMEAKIEDLIYGTTDDGTDHYQGFIDGCIALLTSKYGRISDFQSVYEEIVQKNHRSHPNYYFFVGKLTAFCAGEVRPK